MKTGFRGIGVLALRATLSTAALIAGSAVASAQAPAESTTASQANAQGATEEIVVVAQKRAERIQDVPLTITAFSAEQLKQSNVLKAVDLVRITPGLTVGGSYGGQSLTFGIRGVVQQDYSPQAESPNAVYMDDGYFALGNSAGVGLFDIDHVEVLKGPQGTLFGRNATGGVINIYSIKPSFETNGYLEVGYGTHNDVTAKAAFNAPINDKLAVRFALSAERRDNYIENIFPGGQDVGGTKDIQGRVHLLYKPNEDFSALLTGYISRASGSWGAYYYPASQNVTNSAGQVIDSFLTPSVPVFGLVATPGGSDKLNDAVVRDHGTHNDLTGGTLKAEWNFGPTLTSITDYKVADTKTIITGSPVDVFDLLASSRVSNVTQEFRLQGEAGRLHWFTGLYYLHISARSRPVKGVFFQSVIVTDTDQEITDSYSAFAQAEYNVTDKLKLIAGIRYTDEKKKFDYESNLYGFAGVHNGKYPLGAFLGPARGSLHLSSQNTLIPMKAGIQYYPSKDSMIYLSWSLGKKAGNFTAPIAGDTTFPDDQLTYQPETLTAYELGSKNDFLDGRVRLNAAVYFYDYKNFQTFRAQNTSNIVTNNKAHVVGAEFDARIRPIHGLELTLSGNYSDTRVNNVIVNGVVWPTRAIPFTPKFSGVAGINYSWNMFGGTANAGFDAQYSSKTYYSVSNFTSTTIHSYVLENVHLSWTDAQDLWNVSMFVNNLSDERYQTVGFDLTGFCGCSAQAWGMSRTAGFSVRRNF